MEPVNAKLITVEVAYALPDEQVILSLEVPDNTTVEQAVKRSGILERYPQINIEKDKVGIFGKICKMDATLSHKDRIEIYRPLIADPKESRRKKPRWKRKTKPQKPLTIRFQPIQFCIGKARLFAGFDMKWPTYFTIKIGF